MHYSPKLKKAMEAIQAIIKENDIAGFVVLHTPGFSEYINEVSPSYSCAKAEEGGLRFHLKAAEVGEANAKDLAGKTYDMITHLTDVIGMHALAYVDAHDYLKEKWGDQKGPNTHTSHIEQSN